MFLPDTGRVVSYYKRSPKLFSADVQTPRPTTPPSFPFYVHLRRCCKSSSTKECRLRAPISFLYMRDSPTALYSSQSLANWLARLSHFLNSIAHFLASVQAKFVGFSVGYLSFRGPLGGNSVPTANIGIQSANIRMSKLQDVNASLQLPL